MKSSVLKFLDDFTPALWCSLLLECDMWIQSLSLWKCVQFKHTEVRGTVDDVFCKEERTCHVLMRTRHSLWHSLHVSLTIPGFLEFHTQQLCLFMYPPTWNVSLETRYFNHSISYLIFCNMEEATSSHTTVFWKSFGICRDKISNICTIHCTLWIKGCWALNLLFTLSQTPNESLPSRFHFVWWHWWWARALPFLYSANYSDLFLSLQNVFTRERGFTMSFWTFLNTMWIHFMRMSSAEKRLLP